MQSVDAKNVTTIDAFVYNRELLIEESNISLSRIDELRNFSAILWLNVSSISDRELLRQLGEKFEIHPLSLEDIANKRERPKAEEYPDYIFSVIKMLSFDNREGLVKTEHVSFVLGDGYVISFLEDEGDVFNPVRERLRNAKGRLRQGGSDLCLYALMDAVVDEYFVVFEQIGDIIDEMEENVFELTSKVNLQQIHDMRSEVLASRKVIWPLREEIATLSKINSTLIKEETGVYWRDLYDHTVQIIEILESYRDTLSGIHDSYLSAQSYRMNTNMQALTTIATIFIPLTFIAGVYGMNFDFMPELKWKYGYLYIWIIMILVAVGLVKYFRKKNLF